jgi:serine protease Do
MRNYWKTMTLSLVLALPLSFGAPASLANELPNFSQLVEKSAPAVVNITSVRHAKKRPTQGNSPFHGMPDELLRHFFGIPGFPGTPQTPRESQPSSGFGSGFLISPEGLIVTNHHVIDGADEVVVRLSDFREFKAQVLGSDARTDVALLKIDAKGLPTLSLGNVDQLSVGEWVLAIGSPFGFDYSVTKGIVSAKKRTLPDDQYVPFIQTDVAINPGNSGGPLLNMKGQVVGINSQIYSRSGGFMGLSFAIPADLASYVIEELKEHGRIERGYLGVQIQEVTYELSQSFDMQKPHGALIAQVFADSPAQKAGLEAGDIITRFDGKEITKSWDLPPLVGMTKVGKRVRLDVLREGKRKVLYATIEPIKEDEQKTARAGSNFNAALGAHLTTLTAEQKADWNLEQGVLVGAVESQKPLAKAGLRNGDVLVSFNGTAIESVRALEKMISQADTKRPHRIRYWRNNVMSFTTLRLE